MAADSPACVLSQGTERRFMPDIGQHLATRPSQALGFPQASWSQPMPAPARTADRTVLLEALVGVLCFGLLVPFAMVSVLGASTVRLLYPAYTLAVGLVIMRRWPTLYPAFMIGVFVFSPFLRRVVDYQAGFVQFNPVLLAPYVALLPAAVPLLRQCLGVSRFGNWAFSAMIGCFVYASFVALFKATIVPALWEPLHWVMPVALAAHIIELQQSDAVRRRVLAALCIVVPLTMVYGVYQYVSPMLWDTVWMQNVNNPTFGDPVAYGIRVFSMMNSPGSTGVFTALSIVILLGEGGLLSIMAVTGFPLMLLTLIRMSWLMCIVGVLATLLLAPARRKMSLMIGIAVFAVFAVVGAGSLSFSTEMDTMLSKRLDTFTTLGNDVSATDRLNTYSDFVDRLSKNVLGEGFGAELSTATEAAHQGTVLDSGILEPSLILGVLAGLVYFISLGAIVVQCYRAQKLTAGRLTSYFALVPTMLVGMVLGSVQSGELGLLAWTGIGILLSAASEIEKPRRMALPRGMFPRPLYRG